MYATDIRGYCDLSWLQWLPISHILMWQELYMSPMHTQQTCRKIQTITHCHYLPTLVYGQGESQHSIVCDLKVIWSSQMMARKHGLCACYWDQDECLYASVLMRVIPATTRCTSMRTDVFPFCNCLFFLAERSLWEFQTNSSKTIS